MKKIIKILFFLIVLLLTNFITGFVMKGYGDTSAQYCDGTIAELNHISKIDYDYINAINEYQTNIKEHSSIFKNFAVQCLKGDFNETGLDNKLKEADMLVEKAKQMEDKILQIKEERSEYIRNAKYAEGYQP